MWLLSNGMALANVGCKYSIELLFLSRGKQTSWRSEHDLPITKFHHTCTEHVLKPAPGTNQNITFNSSESSGRLLLGQPKSDIRLRCERWKGQPHFPHDHRTAYHSSPHSACRGQFASSFQLTQSHPAENICFLFTSLISVKSLYLSHLSWRLNAPGNHL